MPFLALARMSGWLVVPRVFVYILNVCKFFIWHARNDFRFRDIRPGAASVIENVKTRVRFHLPLHFKRFVSSRKRRYFHRRWRPVVLWHPWLVIALSYISSFVCPNLDSSFLSVQIWAVDPFVCPNLGSCSFACLNLDSSFFSD